VGKNTGLREHRTSGHKKGCFDVREKKCYEKTSLKLRQ
jgi:hypothetical protein